MPFISDLEQCNRSILSTARKPQMEFRVVPAMRYVPGWSLLHREVHSWVTIVLSSRLKQDLMFPVGRVAEQ